MVSLSGEYEGPAVLGRVIALAKRENAWAKRIQDTDIPQQITGLPSPPLYKPPRWLDWAHDPVVADPADDERYIALVQAINAMNSAKRAWNSRVSRNAKYSQNEPNETFDEFLAASKDSWIDEFLVWVAQCIEQKVGLFFDY